MEYRFTDTNKKLFAMGLMVIIFLSCAKDEEHPQVSFYHWKSKANTNETIEKALALTNSQKIYLHYFDIDNELLNGFDRGIYPKYAIREVADAFKLHEFVPVVYITNRVFQYKDLDVDWLSDRIVKLVHQISLKHFGKKIKAIQIDCDWTESTKSSYFSLLEALKKEFDVNVTIRLHQIKFHETTGIHSS